MRCISKKFDTCCNKINGQIERGNDSDFNDIYKTTIFKNHFMKKKEDLKKENREKLKLSLIGHVLASS